MSETVEISLESVLSRDNLKRAWAAVKAKAGAGGVDGKGIAETEAPLKPHGPVLREQLLGGEYRPAAVRAVDIAKPGGGSRQLGLPSVRDRELEQRGLSFVRYADAIAVFVSSQRAAERVLKRMRRWLHKHLDLPVNPIKSGARRSGDRALLGFRIHPGGHVSPAPKAIQAAQGTGARAGRPGKASPVSTCASNGKSTATEGGMTAALPIGAARCTSARVGSGGTCASASGGAGTTATDKAK